MRVRLHESGDYYVGTHPSGEEMRLERVSHLLAEVGIGPKFGRNARAAADIGTALHDLVKHFLREGVEPVWEPWDNMPDDRRALLNCWVLWREWWEGAGLVPVDVERCLACARLGYGGMMDLRASSRVTGELEITDYKTSQPATSASSKRAYQLQLAAYALALEESGLGLPSRASIVRVGKTCEAPEVYVAWDNLEGARAAVEAWEHVCHLAFWMREQRLAGELASAKAELAGFWLEATGALLEEVA